jgi:hypothetical protein
MSLDEAKQTFEGVSLRNTPLYKRLTPYDACAIAEEFDGRHSREEELCAWQYLHDTRVAYSLQGWYGRTATDLIRSGEIEP